MVKKLILVFAAFTTLSALLVGIHSLLVDEGSIAWIASKTAISAAIVAVGILTWRHGHTQVARNTIEQLLLVGAMGLLLFGAAGIVWTFHLAEVTGDFEAWVVFVNLAMISQGVLTIWHLWSEGHRILPA
jgi:hypothetical protein